MTALYGLTAYIELNDRGKKMMLMMTTDDSIYNQFFLSPQPYCPPPQCLPVNKRVCCVFPFFFFHAEHIVPTASTAIVICSMIPTGGIVHGVNQIQISDISIQTTLSCA